MERQGLAQSALGPEGLENELFHMVYFRFNKMLNFKLKFPDQA